jgi:hypothetical protein
MSSSAASRRTIAHARRAAIVLVLPVLACGLTSKPTMSARPQPTPAASAPPLRPSGVDSGPPRPPDDPFGPEFSRGEDGRWCRSWGDVYGCFPLGIDARRLPLLFAPGRVERVRYCIDSDARRSGPLCPAPEWFESAKPEFYWVGCSVRDATRWCACVLAARPTWASDVEARALWNCDPGAEFADP